MTYVNNSISISSTNFHFLASNS